MTTEDYRNAVVRLNEFHKFARGLTPKKQYFKCGINFEMVTKAFIQLGQALKSLNSEKNAQKFPEKPVN